MHLPATPNMKVFFSSVVKCFGKLLKDQVVRWSNNCCPHSVFLSEASRASSAAISLDCRRCSRSLEWSVVLLICMCCTTAASASPIALCMLFAAMSPCVVCSCMFPSAC